MISAVKPDEPASNIQQRDNAIRRGPERPAVKSVLYRNSMAKRDLDARAKKCCRLVATAAVNTQMLIGLDGAKGVEQLAY